MVMRGVTNPTVLTMAWNGVALTRIRHANNNDVSIEHWYILNPSAGVFNLDYDLGAVVTSYTQEIIQVRDFGVIGAQADASGSGAGSPLVNLSPTQGGGTILDTVNLTNAVAYTRNAGQGFIDFDTVGLTTGFCELSVKLSESDGTTPMGGTIAAGAGDWIYTAVEFSPGPLRTFRLPGVAYP